MNDIVEIKNLNRYSCRLPLRQNGLFAIVDATALDHLAQRLDRSPLKHCNLFSGDMAAQREEDAPYLIWLEFEHLSVWKSLLHDLGHENSGICFASKADFNDLRSHWKKWLSVKLDPKEDFVMFRFYDPRILFAFILTLSAAEASAFFGPTNDIFGFHENKLNVVSKSKHVINAKPIAITAGGFVMSATKIAAMENVADHAFQSRLFDYFRIVWPNESAYFSDEELRQEIKLAIQDAQIFGSMRKGDIIRIANVRILRPDIRKDQWIWDQVMNHETQSPKLRAALLEGYLMIEFQSLAQREYYNYQNGRFAIDDFDVNDRRGYLGEVFPDLFLKHRQQ